MCKNVSYCRNIDVCCKRISFFTVNCQNYMKICKNEEKFFVKIMIKKFIFITYSEY